MPVLKENITFVRVLMHHAPVDGIWRDALIVEKLLDAGSRHGGTGHDGRTS